MVKKDCMTIRNFCLKWVNRECIQYLFKLAETEAEPKELRRFTEAVKLESLNAVITPGDDLLVNNSVDKRTRN